MFLSHISPSLKPDFCLDMALEMMGFDVKMPIKEK